MHYLKALRTSTDSSGTISDVEGNAQRGMPKELGIILVSMKVLNGSSSIS